MTPQRIQRKRTKGWRMPENTVYVGRPSRWSNPYRITESEQGFEVRGTGNHLLGLHKTMRKARAHAVEVFQTQIAPEYDLDQLRAELGGKNLACFCPLNQPCHADVLLRLANDPGDDGALFEADPFRTIDPIDYEEKALGADARRTRRQLRALAEGTHPATRVPLHAEAAPADDRSAAGLRCGSCAHMWRKKVGTGEWQKCDQSAGNGDGPDIRQWWPACRLHEEVSNAH